MTQLPAGAGPTAGAYSGAVFVPGGATDPTAPTTTAPSALPFVLWAAASVDAQGRTVATFTAPPTTDWLVRRMLVQSTVQGQALVYVGAIVPANVVSGTVSGAFDENDANQPYLVPAGQSLSIVWLSGGSAQARIEYENAA